MKSHLLKEYCEAEFENIDKVVGELFSVVRTKETNYSIADLAAIASFIHNFYNGIENVLKRILSFMQVEIKDTSTWHRDLLRTSSDKGVIAEDLYEALLNYLSFRHFFVHAYSFTIKWEDLEPLVGALEEILAKFKSAVYNYISKL